MDGEKKKLRLSFGYLILGLWAATGVQRVREKRSQTPEGVSSGNPEAHRDAVRKPLSRFEGIG